MKLKKSFKIPKVIRSLKRKDKTVPLQWPNGRTRQYRYNGQMEGQDSTATMAKWKDRQYRYNGQMEGQTVPLQWPNGRTDIHSLYNGQMEGQTYSTATMAKWKKGQIGKIMI